MDDFDVVAEKVMGFERGHCRSEFGSSIITSCSNISFDCWFYCRWCGQSIYLVSGSIPRCPSFPFPIFSLTSLMKRLGEMGHHTLVRYDPLRESKNFTILLGDHRVCDTDAPFAALCKYVAKEFVEET